MIENRKNRFTIQNQFVAYLDILGYESLVKEKGIPEFAEILDDCIDRSKKMIETFRIIDIAKMRKSENELADFEVKLTDFEVKMKVFSDNFFLHTTRNWLNLISLTTFLQSTFLKHGVFIRGALCYGEICSSEDFVCGDALVEAYKLENEIAIYPRVILDDSFINEACKIHPFNIRFAINAPERLFKRWVFYKDDTDGYKYLDYLTASASVGDLDYFEYIRMQKGLIEKNLEESKNNRVRQKYQWVKNYHNNFCEEHGYEKYLI